MATVISNLHFFLFGFLLSFNWAKVRMYFLRVTQDVEENYKQHEQTQKHLKHWLEPRTQAQNYYDLKIHF